jgi:hypothetical protein
MFGRHRSCTPGVASVFAEYLHRLGSHRRTNARGKGSFEVNVDDDPLVREFRLPVKDFESGLHLTLYGRVLRWGPGWWIHHPDRDASPESPAIAAQLRQIEADDPSQPGRH